MVTVTQEMEEFYQELRALNMDALWRRMPTGAGRTRDSIKPLPSGPRHCPQPKR